MGESDFAEMFNNVVNQDNGSDKNPGPNKYADNLNPSSSDFKDKNPDPNKFSNYLNPGVDNTPPKQPKPQPNTPTNPDMSGAKEPEIEPEKVRADSDDQRVELIENMER